jgi:hypothetical protein
MRGEDARPERAGGAALPADDDGLRDQPEHYHAGEDGDGLDERPPDRGHDARPRAEQELVAVDAAGSR